SPCDVALVLTRISRAEKLCGTARLLMSKRAAELGSERSGGRVSTAEWIGDLSGEGVGKARRDLDTASVLSFHPAVEEALRSGRISPAQAGVLLPALKVDP